MIVATITLKLHDDGAMAISGNIGDVKLALGMLDSARATVESRFGQSEILVPNYDVPVTPDDRLLIQ